MFDKAFAYQNLSHTVEVFNATFKVYPASQEYDQSVQLLANWPSDSVDFVVSVGLRNESFSCRSLDSLIILPPVLDFNRWNTVNIKTTSSGKIDVYVNSIKQCSFLNETPIPIELVMVGDVSRNKNYGKVYYDDITIFTSEKNISDCYPSR